MTVILLVPHGPLSQCLASYLSTRDLKSRLTDRLGFRIVLSLYMDLIVDQVSLSHVPIHIVQPASGSLQEGRGSTAPNTSDLPLPSRPVENHSIFFVFLVLLYTGNNYSHA